MLSVLLAFLLLTLSIGVYFSFKRSLNNVIAWEDLLVVIMRVGDYLQSNPVEISNDLAFPTDVSQLGIAMLPKWPRNNTKDGLLLDIWGSPMQFYAVRINDKVYMKGISAGQDRRFYTQDDIINSEYDDTGNVFHPRNRLKGKE